jgi:Restriction endonuclease NaeI
MRTQIPDSLVAPGHPDFTVISEIEAEILRCSGGLRRLAQFFTQMLRDEIDKLIDTPNTDRRSYSDLEKVEKTYIGTRVEIRLRKFWGFPKGRLDLRIGHHDADVKHTMESGWMIPREAVGMPCVLSAADEDRCLCFLGLAVARRNYLTSGANQDGKVSFAAAAWPNIHWLIRNEAYPRNFWQTLPLETVGRIFEGRSGTDRLVQLFLAVQGRVIPRSVIADTAQQLDPMKRLRANGGARDRLRADGVLVLSGDYDRGHIAKFGLPNCAKGDVVAFKPVAPEHLTYARQTGLLGA